MAAQTLFEKLWTAHTVADLGGGAALIYIDRIFLHERTGSIALISLAEAGRRVATPGKVFCTMDHIVDTFPGRGDETRMPGGRDFIRMTRKAAWAAGIKLFDIGMEQQGIVHVISPEQGIVLPGLTLVCPDSHTCTQGAFGALAWGIGSTEAEHALATNTLRLKKPKSMRVKFDGDVPRGVTAKDMILHLIGTYGAGGGNGYVVEFTGAAVRQLSMEGRMTLCNMAVEFGAFTGLIAPDEVTLSYLKGRPYAPQGEKWPQAVRAWRELVTDEEAVFDREIVVEASAIRPTVTWGTSPQHCVAIDDTVPDPKSFKDNDTRLAAEKAQKYMGLVPGQKMTDLAIDGAFIGSCTNSRLSDLRRAAEVLRGRKVAEGVRAICVPGSTRVKQEAEREGLDKIFQDAGFEWRESGCSMCFYAGGESFGFQERVVTSTNRNFESRQGPQTRSHLASPETVAASAVAGHLCDAASLRKKEA
ncbi:3-isopropylmalate dehydratase large subunit [Luteithermobacter gelatinilyticus]|uniref:3-isopropylmalate dehydratase large subunit n=1 Tax=Luteithermobacter gelatinilyticus TaxID=2582913 RepID=UPI001106D839|nr:3-isopropylmalate dehydratase large subunit [Luteithermobacter gelatinilyticus]